MFNLFWSKTDKYCATISFSTLDHRPMIIIFNRWPISINRIIPQTRFKWNCHHLKLIARRNVVDRKNRIKGLSRQNCIRWTDIQRTDNHWYAISIWWRCLTTKFNWVCTELPTRWNLYNGGGGGHHNWSNRGLNESQISLSVSLSVRDWLVVVKWHCGWLAFNLNLSGPQISIFNVTVIIKIILVSLCFLWWLSSNNDPELAPQKNRRTRQVRHVCYRALA